MNFTKIERVIAHALPKRLVRRWFRLLAEADPATWTVPSWQPGDGSWPDQQLQEMLRESKDPKHRPCGPRQSLSEAATKDRLLQSQSSGY